jgi:hypothetical protein
MIAAARGRGKLGIGSPVPTFCRFEVSPRPHAQSRRYFF